MKKTLLSIAIAMGLATSLQSCSNGEQGVLNGEFSVSGSQKVKFSSGNLQYEIATKTWKLAENQWDVLGSKNNQLDNDDNYQGVIDLFAFGSADEGAYHGREEREFSEWGKNPIVNASNKANEFRTLSAKEWQYLILERENALNLLHLAKIGDQKGIVILSDDFKAPDGAKIFAIKETDYRKSSSMLDFKNSDSVFNANVYSAEEFKKLEKAGALFLAYCGHHFTKVEDNKEAGYWSTGNDRGGSYLSAGSKSIWPDRGCKCDVYRFAVRLVKDSKK